MHLALQRPKFEPCWRKNHTWTQYSDVAWLCWKKLTWEVVLRYGPCKLVNIPNFGYKVPTRCVFTETWQLKWIGIPRIYSFFGGRLGLPQFLDCKGKGKENVAYGEDFGLKVCGGRFKISWPAILHVQILWLLNVPFFEIKRCGVVLSFCIKIMKWRTLQTCSIKQSIKKSMFSVWANRTQLIWTGAVLPPFLPCKHL